MEQWPGVANSMRAEYVEACVMPSEKCLVKNRIESPFQFPANPQDKPQTG